MSKPSMLTVIDLSVIKKIFDNTQGKLPGQSQILYINCLMHHFNNKPAAFNQSSAFDLAFGPAQFKKFIKQYDQLQINGLIQYKDHVIHFPNLWGQYINPVRFDNEQTKITVDMFISSLKGSNTMIEVGAMKHHLSRSQMANLIDIFIKEQQATKKEYKNESDCLKHFSYWVGQSKNNINNKTVTSTSKILGSEKPK